MTRVAFSRAFRAFFTTEAVATFVVGAVGVAVLGNAVSDLLKKWLGDDTPGLLQVAGLAVVVPVAGVILFAWVLARTGRSVAKLDKQPPAACPGLIFLVGRAEVFEKAVGPHESVLRHVWLVHSPESFPEAERIAAGQRAKGRHVSLSAVADVHDPDGFLRAVRGVYAGLPTDLDPGQVIADYTGMTAHASVGLTLACLEAGAPMQYTPQATRGLVPGTESLQPFRVMIREVPGPRPSSRA